MPCGSPTSPMCRRGPGWPTCASSSTRSQPAHRRWRVAAHMRTDMVLDALEMARRSRGNRRLVGLVAHADAGSQFTSVRFTERLDEIGARPSIGTVVDSFDNALAETTNGLYKTDASEDQTPQPLGRRRPTRTRDPLVGPLVQRAPPHGHCATSRPPVRSSVLAAEQPDPARVGNQ